MNAAQRLLISTVARIVPDFRKLIETAGGSLRVADKAIAAMIASQREDQYESNRRKAEMREAYDLAGSGPEMCAIVEGRAVNVHAAHESKLRESLWELELALEDRGWQRQLAIASTEFSRYGIQQLILISRLYMLKNPLIKRGVYVSSYYVFGRGFEISSNDDAANQTIQDFLNDHNNARELGHTGLVEKHRSLQTDGNLFFALFTDKGTGDVQVRTIDATEIMDKVTDPDDSSVDWYYRRNWSPVKFDPSSAQGYSSAGRVDEWYPAIDYKPIGTPPDAIGGHPINWDVPLMHIKTGGIPKWKFGCPEVYAAINDARAYVDFLKDWCTIQRAYTRFSWDIEQPGGQQAIAGASQAVSTTLGVGGTSIENNPPPTVGAALVRSPGTKFTPIKTSGYATGPEEARRILLNVAAAFGLPETFFGDASTGSLATAQSLDRPTELKFLEAQELWREVLSRIIVFVLDKSQRGAKGKLREIHRGAHRYIAMREAPAAKKENETAVVVKFPAVLEHDIAQMVTAIVQAGTMGGFQPAGTVPLKQLAIALMAEIGIENPEESFGEMYPNYDATVGDGTGQPEQDAAAAGAQPQAHPKLPTPSFGAESARMVRVLAEALAKMEREGKLRRTA